MIVNNFILSLPEVSSGSLDQVVPRIVHRVHPSQLVVKDAAKHARLLIFNRVKRVVVFASLAVVPVEPRPKLQSLLSRRVQSLVVALVLGERAPREPVSRVVRIWVLAWLILDPALGILAAEKRIGLERMLVVEPFALEIAFAFHGDV